MSLRAIAHHMPRQRAWSMGHGAWGKPTGRFDRNEEAEVDENSKFQITNNKQITMTEIRNFKSLLVIEYWNLRFVWDLVLEI